MPQHSRSKRLPWHLELQEKSGRSPVSRILSLPPVRDWAIISLPACAGARLRGTATNTRGYDGRATLPLFCLAPRGVCRAAPVARTRGGLLPHPFTLTPLRSTSYEGRYTLCCTFRPAALTLPSPFFKRHVALRCPDFPRPCKQGRDHPESGGASLRPEVPSEKCQVTKRPGRVGRGMRSPSDGFCG